MNKNYRKVALVAMLVMFWPLAVYGQGSGQGPGPDAPPEGPQARQCRVPTLLWELPYESLRPREASNLRLMRSEEKLARDVYLSLYEHWGLRLFRKISRQERNHMEWTLALCHKYELPDPVAGDGIGVFSDEALQTLYTDLVRAGSDSLVDAFTVGVALEELNLFDLITRAYRRSDNQDLHALYQNLMKASRNHLRIFYKRLEAWGVSYEPAYLSEETFAGIVNSPLERGMVDTDGEWICGGWK